MSKAEKITKNKNSVLAKVKSIRTSPRKLNIVADAIRKLRAEDALIQLEFMKRRVANDVKACLQSAIANAENNNNLDIDSLWVSRVLVGKSFVMKRVRPRARGRSSRIHKPFSNLTIIIEERKE